MQETQVQFLDREDPLEKEMATHSSVLAWEIPWTEEPDRLKSTGSQRVGQDLATNQLLVCSSSAGMIFLKCTLDLDTSFAFNTGV